MKLRRAMATAAATAVIAPLALLSAPTAFADETPSTSTSSPAADESTPAADETTPAADESTPAGDESTPAADESTPAGDESTPAADESTPAADESTPAGDESSSASPSPSPSASTPAGGELCVDENGDSTAELSDALKSGLSGLPDTIVAGSGWTAFSFNVSNHGDQEIKDIKPLIGVAAVGWEDAQDYSGQIKVQVFDKSTKSWQTIADAAGEGGTFTAFSLGAGQSVSYQLRLSVSGKVPDSLGLTGGLAEYADEQGCWLADDPNGWVYFFDILAAGSDPGKPGDAKPQTGGMKPIKNVNEVDATGSLAETGSSSALPMIGLTGGLAVALGAGAVFVVRRRKAGAQA
ncbi:LAETG motif-containing sortase-dependent surface protein [Streptomyces sp. NPDC057616]|uniref:LAETG motif-containing sortase-dependent surface protein n=1 Tax=Streptomyces sp. NPDC057616 TaxID=3346183 RepID=UPI0036A2F133